MSRKYLLTAITEITTREYNRGPGNLGVCMAEFGDGYAVWDCVIPEGGGTPYQTGNGDYFTTHTLMQPKLVAMRAFAERVQKRLDADYRRTRAAEGA